MEKSFSWLHLSDLHIRSLSSWDSDRVTESLVEFLRSRGQRSDFRPDAVFFTGDCTYGSEKNESIEEQYQKFGEFLDAVRSAFQPDLEKSQIFLVPGNHDVDRGEILESDTSWLRSSERNLHEIISHISSASKEFRHWTRRQGAYANFLTEYELFHLSPESHQRIWAHKIATENGKVGIAGLNSSWTCATNREKSQLWMGGKWQSSYLSSELKKCSLKIALIHHPANWLTEEDPKFWRQLQNDFDIIFHGHEHSPFVNQLANGKVIVSAGACYERHDREKAFSIGSVRLDKAGGEVEIFEWDDVGFGWVTKNVAHHAQNGIFSLRPLFVEDSAAVSPSLSLQSEPQEVLISVEGPPSNETLLERLNYLHRRPYRFLGHHARVRVSLRDEFEQRLLESRFSWLIADWQMGADGFIAAALNNFGSSKALESAYRVDCSKLNSLEELFDESGSQLGLSLIEFGEVLTRVGGGTLIFEDFQTRLLRDTNQIAELEASVTAILGFSPLLKVIIILRHPIEGLPSESVTRLDALEIPEVATYIRWHPEGGELRKRKDRLEGIYSYTGGLPSQIDRLIVKVRSVDLDHLIDNPAQLSEAAQLEAPPASLTGTVDAVFSAEGDANRRIAALLKLLTILRDGETLDSIRYIYRKKPFNEMHVVALADLGLIEAFPIVQGSQTVVLSVPGRSNPTRVRKLLRVPKQVREYVDSLISPDERAKIYGAVTEPLFGSKWNQGEVQLRNSIVVAYKQSTISGPANELFVALYLLNSALERNNRAKIDQFAQLAVSYCSELVGQDRYRDAVLSCRAILRILEECDRETQWATCMFLYGKSLRMIGDHRESRDVIERILKTRIVKAKDFLCKIHLNLAWTYESLGQTSQALESVEIVIENSEREDPNWIQAASIAFGIQLSGGKLQSALKGLLQIARKKRYNYVGNNIALQLATMSKSTKESVRLVDDVLILAKDPYNRSRAAIQKARMLRSSGRLEMLSSEEEAGLCSAYEYSCTQRLGTLLVSSHELLWDYCRCKNFIIGLFRIFRFSSFIWRITDNEEQEEVYLPILISIRDDHDAEDLEVIDVELEYLETRIHGDQ